MNHKKPRVRLHTPEDRSLLKEQMDMSALFPGIRFIPILPAVLQFLSPAEAIVLMAILDQYRDLGSQPELKEYKGWYFYTVEKMERDTGLTQSTQYRILKRLKDLRLISIRQPNSTRRRYIFLHLKTLQSMVEEANEPEPGE